MTSRSVPIQLDRLRYLTFSFNDFADLQDLDPRIFQKSIGELPVLRRYLWAGLRHEEKRLTEGQIGDLIETFIENGGDMIDLAAKVGEAVNGSAFAQRSKKQADSSVPEEVDASKNSEGSGSTA